jgi:hypothetical protein
MLRAAGILADCAHHTLYPPRMKFNVSACSYNLDMEVGGNVVEYNTSGTIEWTSGSHCKSTNCVLVLMYNVELMVKDLTDDSIIWRNAKWASRRFQ